MLIGNCGNFHAILMEEGNHYLSTKCDGILCELTNFRLGKVLGSVKNTTPHSVEAIPFLFEVFEVQVCKYTQDTLTQTRTMKTSPQCISNLLAFHVRFIFVFKISC